MAKTVIGLMDTQQEAEDVVRELTTACGCERGDIGLMTRRVEGDSGRHAAGDDDSDEGLSGALTGAGTGAAVGGVVGLVAGVASLAIPGFGPIIAAGPIASTLAGAGIGAVAGGLIGGLIDLGVPEDEAHYYAEGVKRGGTLVTVHARDDETANCALQVMERHGAVDINERAEQWTQEGWSGRFDEEDARALKEDEERVIPVVQEEVAVGKRQVQQGGVRVYVQLVEREIEESIPLREERAIVERRPVDRPVEAGDDAFREQTIEVSETSEEPVVSKRARVTEEVRVGKESAEREQTVRDRVRETDVRVERQGEKDRQDLQNAAGSSATYRGPDRRRRRASFSGPDRRTPAGGML
jgi:uncharacterized protein (TIGR02271 family)